MSDKELGLKVFRAFHSWNKSFHPISFTISFDDFVNSYGKKKDIYLENIGSAIRENKISDSRIDSAMRSMAQKSGGKIPENPLVIFQFLSNEAVKINWVDAIAYTAIESAKDIGTGAVAIGDSIIKTGKIVNFLLPALVLLFLFLWLNKGTGGELKRLFK